MILSDLKYINAINILVSAKIGALQGVNDKFKGNWQRAWEYRLAENKLAINPDKEWQKLEKEKIEITTIDSPAYPELLKQIHDPPFALYARGNQKILDSFSLGVVGTRRATEYGKSAAREITANLARSGATVISGLARGIDTTAHRTALDAGALTVAVLGTGIDDATIYPASNLGLAHKIIKEGGAIISEYAPGTHGTPFSFPQRNRIISGLSRGVVVVEADYKSGALITARSATEQNRDVFAVPGSIFARTSRGTNSIIGRGAKAISCADDILEEYGIYLEKLEKQNSRTGGEDEIENKILTVLTKEQEPILMNELVRRTGLGASEVGARLVMMELNRKIKKVGERYTIY